MKASGIWRKRRLLTRSSLLLAPILLLALAGPPAWSVDNVAAAPAQSLNRIVPAPVVVRPLPVTFRLDPADAIYTTGSPQAKKVGALLGDLLRPSTGYSLPLKTASSPGQGGIFLLLTNVGAAPQLAGLGEQANEGYLLETTNRSVVIRALSAEGLFNGVQTLRQLLPAAVESKTMQSGPWTVPGAFVLDYPRYTYRATMLDLARHFFDLSDVERYIDEISLYKINYLHLHLSDDQGWRLAINGMPALTEIGGSTGEAGFLGGFFTQQDYQALVAYAQDRQVTIVPEIEGPVHSTAALASLPEINCDGTPPDLYIGIGASPDGALCTDFGPTYKFLDTVIGQIAALTPGPYLHIGGDEASFLSAAQYATYIHKVQAIVAKYGKKLIGWQETLAASDPAKSTGELWVSGLNDEQVLNAARHGAKLIMAPAEHTFLDMRYSADGPPEWWLGLTWAGYVEVQNAYEWDPTTVLAGLPSSAIAGVEAPLWTDTVFGGIYIEEMAFPRLPAVAEVGWSPRSSHNWDAFRQRLAAQGARWTVMGVYYYPSPQIAWP